MVGHLSAGTFFLHLEAAHGVISNALAIAETPPTIWSALSYAVVVGLFIRIKNPTLSSTSILPIIEMMQMSKGLKVLHMVEKAKYSEFAQRLNDAMKAADLSVTDLKDRLGVTYEMARRYTLGTAFPRFGKMSKLADILGVDASQLAYGKTKRSIFSLNDRDYEMLKEIADHKGVTVSELADTLLGRNPPNKEAQSKNEVCDQSVPERELNHAFALPKTTTILIRSFAQIINREQGTEPMTVFGDLPDSAYGYRLDTDHMEGAPVFIPRGAMLVISPDLSPIDGDIVLANIEGPAIGLLSKVGGKQMVVATRDKIPALEVEKQNILGVVLKWEVEHRNPARDTR